MLSGGDCTPVVRVSVSKLKGLPVAIGKCALCCCWAKLGWQGLFDGWDSRAVPKLPAGPPS